MIIIITIIATKNKIRSGKKEERSSEDFHTHSPTKNFTRVVTNVIHR